MQAAQTNLWLIITSLGRHSKLDMNRKRSSGNCKHGLLALPLHHTFITDHMKFQVPWQDHQSSFAWISETTSAERSKKTTFEMSCNLQVLTLAKWRFLVDEDRWVAKLSVFQKDWMFGVPLSLNHKMFGTLLSAKETKLSCGLHSPSEQVYCLGGFEDFRLFLEISREVLGGLKRNRPVVFLISNF